MSAFLSVLYWVVSVAVGVLLVAAVAVALLFIGFVFCVYLFTRPVDLKETSFREFFGEFASAAWEVTKSEFRYYREKKRNQRKDRL